LPETIELPGGRQASAPVGAQPGVEEKDEVETPLVTGEDRFDSGLGRVRGVGSAALAGADGVATARPAAKATVALPRLTIRRAAVAKRTARP
jgi:hypothetical protein